jgi:hypothetical protein
MVHAMAVFILSLLILACGWCSAAPVSGVVHIDSMFGNDQLGDGATSALSSACSDIPTRVSLKITTASFIFHTGTAALFSEHDSARTRPCPCSSLRTTSKANGAINELLMAPKTTSLCAG